MGVTYKAIDINLQCPVALKVINARFIGDESARRRFVREARAAASVHHPNVASVFHLGQSADGYFYAMEFVEGETLESLIKRCGRLEAKVALEITSQVAAGLAATHEQNLVHRDIKPTNIRVSLKDGGLLTAKIIDLGLAKPVADAPTDVAISTPGAFAGTPEFASPEQFAGVGADIRSDLYSLGATLWQMLTGQAPFRGTAAELMYRHLHAPLAIRELENLPQPIVALIEVLLEKDPSRRFQTPAELVKAISKVRDSICAGLTITHQSLHETPADFSGFITRKGKLYGRDAEREVLLCAFDRVAANGISELVLVSGYSGIGKSSIVNELRKVVALPRGIFISGKSDPLTRDVPYAGMVQAFQAVVAKILGESAEQIALWRKLIQEAVGTNGQLLVELIPGLKLVIGEQPPVPEVSPQDAQNRFQIALRRFLSAFAQPEHPMALFFDNLHWLDSATLELIEHLIRTQEVRYLLLIGAYRDNEVRSSHPLERMLTAVRESGAIVREIVLAPLAFEAVRLLLADALQTESEHILPLARLVHEKTAGNPFFVIQFLARLAEERLLVFDSAAATWNWDLARIGAMGYTDNVVDLMAGKLSRLPTKTQQALAQLAFLGSSAETPILALILNESEEQLHAVFWEAVRIGLVFQVENAYTFVHDRVQEASYALISPNERAAVHLRIGRLLVSRTLPDELENNIFEIVSQLNRGAELIDSPQERERFAQFNLVAGKRAIESTAYASALKYFAAGRQLLAADSWERQYALTFEIEFHRAECEFLTGDLTAAEARLLLLSQHARDLTDSAAVARLQTELYGALDRSDRAVVVGLDYLKRIGIDLPPHPTDDALRQEYERVLQQLGNRPIEALLDLPPMTDPAWLATLDVLTAVEAHSFFIDEDLRCLVVSRIANLSLEYGNTDGSSIAYVQLGWLVAPRFGDYHAAFRFGQLGLDLVEKRGLERFRARVSQCFAYFISPWSRHLRDSLGLLRQSFGSALATGDLKYAVFSCDRLVTMLLGAGDPLSDVQRDAEIGLEFVGKAKFGFVTETILGQLRFIRALQGLTKSLSSFDDPEFDEDSLKRNWSANLNSTFGKKRARIAQCWYWIRKLQVYYYADDYSSALQAASMAEPLLQAGPGHFEHAEYTFYSALTQAAHYDSASSEKKVEYRALLDCNYQQLAVWAENCPANFGNRAALVAAEIERISGRELDAERLYEKAIQSAREHGFIHIEAVAHEVAARFYGSRGLQTVAHAYLRNARFCYLRWGAFGKVRHLDQSYPYLQKERTSM
jgi:predicted ATPase